jgi:hypothetical protein
MTTTIVFDADVALRLPQARWIHVKLPADLEAFAPNAAKPMLHERSRGILRVQSVLWKRALSTAARSKPGTWQGRPPE